MSEERSYEEFNPKLAEQKTPAEYKDRVTKLTIDELVREFAESRKRLDATVAAKKAATMEYDYLRGVLLPQKFEESETALHRPKDGRGVRVGTALFVSVLKANKPGLFQWLRENNAESMITETVHASSLKAFVKSAIQSGRPVPGDDIASIQALPVATFC